MLQREQNLIADVLQKAHLTELPKKSNNKSVWIEAIAKIRLGNASIAYGIIKKNPDMSYRVTYLNGDVSPIVEIEEVYPYITINKDYIKKFGKKEDEKERIEYLKSLKLPYANAVGYFDNMTIDELNKEVVKAAMWRQMQDMSK